eukprot:TRINITY_DN31364_c0_g1_i2.p1 TRINITY_DN31364_c0_g1~~TRINITY_DN31364_c0_g1_i2.p1  ORF type:complete len:285 (+),score=59.97 TRINITY_DN31364_c0_g1_i2:46-900(+)
MPREEPGTVYINAQPDDSSLLKELRSTLATEVKAGVKKFQHDHDWHLEQRSKSIEEMQKLREQIQELTIVSAIVNSAYYDRSWTWNKLYEYLRSVELSPALMKLSDDDLKGSGKYHLLRAIRSHQEYCGTRRKNRLKEGEYFESLSRASEDVYLSRELLSVKKLESESSGYGFSGHGKARSSAKRRAQSARRPDPSRGATDRDFEKTNRFFDFVEDHVCNGIDNVQRDRADAERKLRRLQEQNVFDSLKAKRSLEQDLFNMSQQRRREPLPGKANLLLEALLAR